MADTSNGGSAAELLSGGFKGFTSFFCARLASSGRVGIRHVNDSPRIKHTPVFIYLPVVLQTAEARGNESGCEQEDAKIAKKGHSVRPMLGRSL